MIGNWAGYKVFNHPNNSLMVDLRVRLSRPCGNNQQDYNRRKYPINELYDDPITSCHYWAPDGISQEHPLYFETGFADEELDIYYQNTYLDDIQNKIPTWIYKQSDL